MNKTQKVEIELRTLKNWRDDIQSAFEGKFPHDEVASDIMQALDEEIGKHEPVQKWREATTEDVGEEVSFVEFGSSTGEEEFGKLLYVDNGEFFILNKDRNISIVKECQILAEPEKLTPSQKAYMKKLDEIIFPTLEQRIQAQWPDKRVEMLWRDDDGLLSFTCPNSYGGIQFENHCGAPSAKDFAGFVYERTVNDFCDGSYVFFVDLTRPVREGEIDNHTPWFPVAVLFEQEAE